MIQKHEELVEEVRLVWCKDCGDGPSRYEYSPDLDDDACEGGVETIKLCRERARECVTHVLSAFRDRRLDEELGVEGRHDLGWPDRYHEVAHGWIDNLPDISLELIALRPLMGTGKEEEK